MGHRFGKNLTGCRWRAGLALVCGLLLVPPGRSQGVDASLRVGVDTGKHSSTMHGGPSPVVVWLTPEKSGTLPQRPNGSQAYTLVQKDKQFLPHVLVVPTGSSVDFPNLDPFFHNVFSLFNGKRFDLGLYESHAHHKVQFDREGVSYIFCNIHPEMAAVVVALSTPYYAISTADGVAVIHDVTPGNYRLNFWAENVPLDSLNGLSRYVEVNEKNTQLGSFRLEATGDMTAHHKNKFGESYTPASGGPY